MVKNINSVPIAEYTIESAKRSLNPALHFRQKSFILIWHDCLSKRNGTSVPITINVYRMPVFIRELLSLYIPILIKYSFKNSGRIRTISAYNNSAIPAVENCLLANSFETLIFFLLINI